MFGSQLDGWTFVDADNDGYNFERLLASDSARSGTEALASVSYSDDIGTLTPDNWAIMPAGLVPNEGTPTVSL